MWVADVVALSNVEHDVRGPAGEIAVWRGLGPRPAS
jgi:hypothetical protein